MGLRRLICIGGLRMCYACVRETSCCCAKEGGRGNDLSSSLGMYFFLASSNCDLYFLRKDILIRYTYMGEKTTPKGGKVEGKEKEKLLCSVEVVVVQAAPQRSRLSSSMLKGP